MTTKTAPRLLRDLPLGADGLRGRLLVLEREHLTRRFQLVYYRGTSPQAKQAVAAAQVSALRELYDGRADVERRQGRSTDLVSAVAAALDLPWADRVVRRTAELIGQLEGWQ